MNNFRIVEEFATISSFEVYPVEDEEWITVCDQELENSYICINGVPNYCSNNALMNNYTSQYRNQTRILLLCSQHRFAISY